MSARQSLTESGREASTYDFIDRLIHRAYHHRCRMFVAASHYVRRSCRILPYSIEGK